MKTSSRKQQSKIIRDFIEGCSEQNKIDLLQHFLSIYGDLHTAKLEKFNRSLPFSEYFVDRWERARVLGFGEGTSIYDSATVIGNVTVGRETWIGPNVILDGSGGLEIGSFCSISANVQIYTHDTVDWATSGGEKGYRHEATKIANNCYIGPNCVIAMGVTVGCGAIIGANSFVNEDVRSGAKVAGSPAKQIQG